MPSAYDYVSDSNQFYGGEVSGSGLGNPDTAFAAGLSNFFTGDTDYARDLEKLGFQNQFNEYMSSTAYQRAAADLKAAGLNPSLAASGSASSMSSGSGSAPRVPNSMGSVFTLVASLAGAAFNLAGKALDRKRSSLDDKSTHVYIGGRELSNARPVERDYSYLFSKLD